MLSQFFQKAVKIGLIAVGMLLAISNSEGGAQFSISDAIDEGDVAALNDMKIQWGLDWDFDSEPQFIWLDYPGLEGVIFEGFQYHLDTSTDPPTPVIDSKGRVTGISLEEFSLSGSIQPSICNLTELRSLSLVDQDTWPPNLRGGIPATIGNLTKVETIIIIGQIDGSIPTTIGNLTELKSLIIHGNISGSIPTTIGNLTALQNLDLSSNEISGSIAASIGNLTNLTILDLSENRLTGDIPGGIGALAALTSLSLSYNQLSGSIPAAIYSLTELYGLYLGGNELTGSIPATVGNLTNLELLELSGNQLSGSIPASIGNLTKLYWLDLSMNRLTGTIPVEIGTLAELFSLSLGYNQLSGSIPAAISNLPQLVNLSLEDNLLTGSIPASIGNLTELIFLGLSNNKLGGAIPEEIGMLSCDVYLYGNYFTLDAAQRQKFATYLWGDSSILEPQNIPDMTLEPFGSGLQTAPLRWNNIAYFGFDSAFLEVTSEVDISPVVVTLESQNDWITVGEFAVGAANPGPTATTELQAHNNAVFRISVNLPSGSPLGLYTGSVKVKYGEGVTEIPVSYYYSTKFSPVVKDVVTGSFIEGAAIDVLTPSGSRFRVTTGSDGLPSNDGWPVWEQGSYTFTVLAPGYLPSEVTQGFVSGVTGIWSLVQLTPGEFTFTDDGDSITITRFFTNIVGAAAIPAMVIGKPVTRIGFYAFAGYSGMTSVTIPTSVTTLGEGAFFNCDGLTSVAIPASVTSIGYNVFYRTSNLTSIVVDANNPVYSSASGVLFDKLKTTLIRYPCARVGSYVIPSSVMAFAEGAFFDCDGLTSVTIPASVTSIGHSDFRDSNNLTSILVDENNPIYSSASGVLFNKLMTTLIKYPYGRVGSYVIPSSVSSVGEFAFEDCIGLTHVTIPASVTTLAMFAFFGCNSLTSVIIPTSVTSIGDLAFYNCSGLTSTTFLGNAPSFIGESVFDSAADEFTIYYSASANGFTSPEWMGYPTAIIAILNPQVQSWQIAKFGSASAPEAALVFDADKDGLLNLVEYAFKLEPVVPGTPVLITLTGTSGLPRITPVGSGVSQRLRLEYVRMKASSNPGITYIPQFSSILQGSGTGGWAAATGTEVVESIDTEWERVVVEDVAGTGGIQRFGRVKVTSP